MDKKIAKDIRRFSLISNLALNVFTTILMGVGLGWLIDYLFETSIWTPICSVVFTFAAIVNFIKIVIKVSNIDDKKNPKQ